MREIGGEIRMHQKREPAHGAVPLLKLLLSGSIVFRLGLDAFVFIELKRQGDCAVKTVCLAVFAHGEVVKGRHFLWKDARIFEIKLQISQF